MRQVLINLPLNAIQAIDERGDVFCHVYRDSDSFYILVKNDGKCIPPDRLEYLFKPLSSGKETGHGLGRWVTHQIVRQLNGEIAVKSEPAATRFTVAIPFAAGYA